MGKMKSKPKREKQWISGETERRKNCSMQERRGGRTTGESGIQKRRGPTCRKYFTMITLLPPAAGKQNHRFDSSESF